MAIAYCAEALQVANTPLKLIPTIACAGRQRAADLHLPFSAYVGILIRNQEIAPAPLAALAGSGPMVRVHVPLHWRIGLRPLTTRLTRSAGLRSINAFAEALIARDLLSPEEHLAIRATQPKPKIQP